MSDFDDLNPMLESGTIDDTDDTVEITDLEPVQTALSKPTPALSSHITPRRFNRALRIAVVISILFLLLLVLPNGITTLKNIGGRAISSVIPHPLPAGYNKFYLDPAVSGLQVLIDERPVALPRIGIDAPLTFAPGYHVITWLGPPAPFQAQACTLSIPAISSDTCTFSYERATYHSASYRVILLSESLMSLSPQESKMLMQAMNTALSHVAATETVQPGELLTGENGPVPASQPLRATLHFSLATESGSLCPDFTVLLAAQGIPCQIEGQSCLLLCPIPWQTRQDYAQGYTVGGVPFSWFAFAITDASWDYTTLRGQSVGSQEVLGAGSSLLDKQLLLLHITWDDSWHVNVLLSSDLHKPIYINIGIPRGISHLAPIMETILVSDDPACTTAIGYIRSGLTTSPTGGTSQEVHIHLSSANNPALGCLIEASSGNGSAIPQKPANAAYYLVRFGVLLSANDQARLLRPELPYADAYALRIEQQLQQLPGQDVILFVGL